MTTLNTTKASPSNSLTVSKIIDVFLRFTKDYVYVFAILLLGAVFAVLEPKAVVPSLKVHLELKGNGTVALLKGTRLLTQTESWLLMAD